MSAEDFRKTADWRLEEQQILTAMRGLEKVKPRLKSKSRRNGAPGEIRTPGLMLRRHPLYPAELRAREGLAELDYHPWREFCK
jgi:hypothetical protein